jgi:hypothetical protein
MENRIPRARIYDYALLLNNPDWSGALLSDASTAFVHLIELIKTNPGPLIVSNSWGLYNRLNDSPVGSVENYSSNPNHHFNQVTTLLEEAGADVFFAAGNCGEVNPSFKCGLNDIGPGNSIHGANSHPDVINVAAVSINKNWLPYSSQGPGGLEPKKPDISAYSEFRGSGIDTLDGGTSAATPLAAGMAAALRQKIPSGIMKPLEFKKILIQNAFRSEGGDGWNAKTGNGIINTRGLENYFQ